jgi:hypothetical protein
LPKIRRAVGKNRAILYFLDEANVLLMASLGKGGRPRRSSARVQLGHHHVQEHHIGGWLAAQALQGFLAIGDYSS